MSERKRWLGEAWGVLRKSTQSFRAKSIESRCQEAPMAVGGGEDDRREGRAGVGSSHGPKQNLRGETRWGREMGMS